MNRPNIAHEDEHHLVATWGNLLLLIWKNETRLAAIQGLRDTMQGLAKRQPDGMTLLTVIERGAPLPSSTERRALSDVLRDFSGSVLRSAVLIDADGLRAATVRSVITGLTLIARQPYPHRVFGRAAEAAAWLYPTLRFDGAKPNSLELLGAIDTIRGKESGVGGRAPSSRAGAGSV